MKTGLLGMAAILAIALTAAGCRERKVVVVHEQRPVVIERAPVVVERPPVVVQRQPVVVVEQQPQVIIVQEAPPPLRVEVRPRPPSGVYVWVEGYWQYNSHRWEWTRGRWAIPPEHRREWVAPRFERDARDGRDDRGKGGGRYTPGHWR